MLLRNIKFLIVFALLFVGCGETSPNASLPLKGKKVVFFGDSIIEGLTSFSLLGGGREK